MKVRGSHRCIIPASYYFEWEHLVAQDGTKKTDRKYMIQPKDCAVTYLAGLYQIEEQRGIRLPVFTVLTREPGESIRFIHDRMPVILPKELVKAWISPGEKPEAIVKEAVKDYTLLFQHMIFEFHQAINMYGRQNGYGDRQRLLASILMVLKEMMPVMNPEYITNYPASLENIKGLVAHLMIMSVNFTGMHPDEVTA